MAILLILTIRETEADSDTTNTSISEDALISKLEAARNRLENRLNTIGGMPAKEANLLNVSEKSIMEHNMEEIRQEIHDIVGDDDLNDLSEDERERIEELRERYHFWDSFPQPVHPRLVIGETPDGSAKTIAAAVFDPLEPLDPTMVVNGDEVTPFTETALAEAVATATPPPTL